MKIKPGETEIIVNNSHQLLHAKGVEGDITFLLASCYQPGGEKGEMFMCEGRLIADISENFKVIRKALTKEESDALILSVAQADQDGEILVSHTWSYFDEGRDAYVSVGYSDMTLALVTNSEWFKASAADIREQILAAHSAGLTHFLGEFYNLTSRLKPDYVSEITKLTLPEPWTFSRARIEYLSCGFLIAGNYVGKRMCLHMPSPHHKKALRELPYDDFLEHSKTLRRLGVVKWNAKEINEWGKALRQ